MNLAEFKKKNKEVFKNVSESNQYIVYYANTEVCTATGYIKIIKSFPGYVSEDDKGIKQEIIRSGSKKDALINHLFMNADEYGIIQGIENN